MKLYVTEEILSNERMVSMLNITSQICSIVGLFISVIGLVLSTITIIKVHKIQVSIGGKKTTNKKITIKGDRNGYVGGDGDVHDREQ